jgi:hypothetical protein
MFSESTDSRTSNATRESSDRRHETAQARFASEDRKAEPERQHTGSGLRPRGQQTLGRAGRAQPAYGRRCRRARATEGARRRPPSVSGAGGLRRSRRENNCPPLSTNKPSAADRYLSQRLGLGSRHSDDLPPGSSARPAPAALCDHRFRASAARALARAKLSAIQGRNQIRRPARGPAFIGTASQTPPAAAPKKRLRRHTTRAAQRGAPPPAANTSTGTPWPELRFSPAVTNSPGPVATHPRVHPTRVEHHHIYV